MEALKHNFLVRGFFKKRGYEDDSELTKNLIAELPAAPAIKTFTYDQKQIFDKPDTSPHNSAARIRSPMVSGRLAPRPAWGCTWMIGLW